MSLNLRNEIVMEVQLAEKFFRAHFPAGSTYQDCFEALKQFADKVIELSQAYEAIQKDISPASPNQEGDAATAATTVVPDHELLGS